MFTVIRAAAGAVAAVALSGPFLNRAARRDEEFFAALAGAAVLGAFLGAAA